MKAGLLFKLACLLIASMVLMAHLLRKALGRLNGAETSSKRH